MPGLAGQSPNYRGVKIVTGANFIYMKWATALISPIQVAFLRVLFGFLPLVLVAWQRRAITRDQLRLLPLAFAQCCGVLASSPA